jgi:hypothetical protein
MTGCGECKTRCGRNIICCNGKVVSGGYTSLGLFSGVEFSSALGLLSDLLEDGELLERTRGSRGHFGTRKQNFDAEI